MMLEDARAPVVVTHDAPRATLLPTGTRAVASLDAVASARRDAPGAARSVTPDNLAYVIFTSGSTGRPKGVMIEHRNVANFFAGDGRGARRRRARACGSRVTSISFDISVLELFWTLARGFKVVVQEERRRGEPSRPRERPSARGAARAPMDFSLFYFAADAGRGAGDAYRLLLEGAKFADEHGFAAVWTPERHFHAFGGLYPNPAVTSAAVAAVTERIGIRAGSVVLPLHNPIRVRGGVVGGRQPLATVASGCRSRPAGTPATSRSRPTTSRERRELMAQGHRDRPRALARRGGALPGAATGSEVDVRIFPPPVQREPPHLDHRRRLRRDVRDGRAAWAPTS